jgi:hypothetical protein
MKSEAAATKRPQLSSDVTSITSNNKIPQDDQPVKDKNSEAISKENHLTKTEKRFMGLLCFKRDWYRAKNKLQPDGSFFVDNISIAAECGCKKRNIIRTKQSLKAKGFISYKKGNGRGKATYYRVLDKTPEKIKPVAPADEGPRQLVPAEVRQDMKFFGRDHAIETWVRMGFQKAEVEACLTE